MPRVLESEFLEINVMAKLMAEGTQEGAERRNFFANCRSHPDPDKHEVRGAVTKQFECPMLTGAQRSGG
jgi:hypothetical protein